MKLIIVILCTVTAFGSFAQGKKPRLTTAQHPADSKTLSNTVKPSGGISKSDANLLSRELIIGNYKIDTIYTYNEEYSEEELPTFAINDTVGITKDKIILKEGNQEFMIFDSEEMPKADYFYRMFLVTGDNYPADLPERIAVHKTDNPHIYGLGLLTNGTILLPFEGQLIILNEIVPEKK